ncbi:MAG: hypothetical protein SGJ17_05230 [Hyphomicrobiales bacterium]|nr:hypothetical protein [Hyphomicrobiales bacterium]
MTLRKPMQTVLCISLAFSVLALAGCGVPTLSSAFKGGIFDSDKPKPQTAWTPQVTEANLIAAAQTNAPQPDTGAANVDCPKFFVAPVDKVITIYEAGRLNDNQYVMHRGEITKTSRECQISGNAMIVRYGFAGRVILGPKGRPGALTLPAVVQVTDQAKAKVKADSVKIQVQISLEDPVAYFSIVRQIEFPIAGGAAAKDYRLSASFEKKAPGAT